MYTSVFRTDYCTTGNDFTEPEVRKGMKKASCGKQDLAVGQSGWLCAVSVEDKPYNISWFQDVAVLPS